VKYATEKRQNAMMAPRIIGAPRPVFSPVSESASAKAMPNAGTNRGREAIRSVVCELCVANAAAK